MNEGWYPDPLDPQRQRYWRGDHWSPEVAAADGTVVEDGLMSAVQSAPTPPPPPGFAPGYPPPATAPVAVGRPTPVPGWWLSIVIAVLSFGFVFLPQTSSSGDSAYGFEDFNGDFDWGAALPFFIGIAVLVVGAIAGRMGRVGLTAIAAGAALYMGAGVLLVYSLVLEVIFSGIGVSIGPGALCALAACAASFVFAVVMISTSMRTAPRTTPIGLSIVVSIAAAGVAALLFSLFSDYDSDSFWTDSGWINAAFVLFLIPNALNIVLPLVRSNAAALGLVGGYTSIYAADYVIALADGRTTLVAGESGIGGLTVVAVAGGGILLALIFDRVLIRPSSYSLSDLPARSVGLVVTAAVLTGLMFVLWAVNESSSNSWAGSCANAYEACDYGDDYYLDSLWDACSSGDGWACGRLYWDSPVGSHYEHFGSTCGGRKPEMSSCY